MANSKEAKARIKINKLLEESGWRFFDNENGKANIQLEPGVKLTKTKLDSLGNDFETETKGFVDYLLLDEEGSDKRRNWQIFGILRKSKTCQKNYGNPEYYGA